MHPSSIENMKKAKEKYLRGHSLMAVLDVGGGRHNYGDLFPEAVEYYVADVEDGLGVTHVMPGPYTLPWPDGLFDLVVSGQMLEHCANPFRSVAEMVRVLVPGGYVVLIAPSAGPYHFKQDCWRFMDDAFRCIAEEVGLETVADWVDRSAPDKRSRKWQDHVFIGVKR